MSKKILYGFLFMLAGTLAAAPDIYEEIAAGMRSGNSKELAKYFEASVDLTILSQEEVYSKTQAELVLKDFFQKNTPKSFTILHKSPVKDGPMYAIGNLATTGGIYRTTIFIKQAGGRSVIRELRFEKD